MHQEVELTAEVTEREYAKLHAYLSKRFKRTAKQQRFMIRFFENTVQERHPLDIRYKWTNGAQELVVKKGALGSQGRKEMHIPLMGENQVQNFVHLFSLMGYRTADAMYRDIERFEDGDVEVSLTIAEPYRFVEVESLGARKKRDAIAAVGHFFKKVKLVPMTKLQYQKQLRRFDREVNLIFPLAEFPHPLLATPKWRTITAKTIFKR